MTTQRKAFVPRNEFERVSLQFVRERLEEGQAGAFWFGMHVALADPALASTMIAQAIAFDPDLGSDEMWDDINFVLETARGANA